MDIEWCLLGIILAIPCYTQYIIEWDAYNTGFKQQVFKQQESAKPPILWGNWYQHLKHMNINVNMICSHKNRLKINVWEIPD
jgi:hypothetical protein